ncbi:hydroxyacylglutathione hydrolase [Hyphococcus luteus]|uniref:Hydroxyacylglutathione hydrolase n=1 Tax=Hyphococcus luteus TaxID=2058213 RepID=A0A2S7K8D0_9PROT|nr:hydroxyacylglutathione hydrolase [Marinicaulis flavus]PQA88764.1 hydroxyacylglutathione hydrolase [Marinicaulis flavus]
MPIDIRQFACLSDNYGYLVHDRETGETAAIDTPDAEAINRELEKAGWRLTHIFNTHHHFDHAGGNLALKDKWGCEIIGPKGEAGRIPGIDRPVGEGDSVELGASTAIVHETPGHTLGHIIYYFPETHAAFVGDTIFAMGCGRLFEGTADQMWSSLSKIAAMPADTKIYCAHEYTKANAAFALSVDPDNDDLKKRAEEVDALRAKGTPTVPTTVALELATNPFLRASDKNLQAAIGMEGAKAVDAFAKTRALKDSF